MAEKIQICEEITWAMPRTSPDSMLYSSVSLLLSTVETNIWPAYHQGDAVYLGGDVS